METEWFNNTDSSVQVGRNKKKFYEKGQDYLLEVSDADNKWIRIWLNVNGQSLVSIC